MMRYFTLPCEDYPSLLLLEITAGGSRVRSGSGMAMDITWLKDAGLDLGLGYLLLFYLRRSHLRAFCEVKF